ncbi:hypothetical protein AB833_21095 [Chromatiales bacterium (ex Bugula neritina AB1)]|nr:hypothetical protein AB833_21095 [Chromatiales bacterium (ex Bugula neritina AB1)]
MRKLFFVCIIVAGFSYYHNNVNKLPIDRVFAPVAAAISANDSAIRDSGKSKDEGFLKSFMESPAIVAMIDTADKAAYLSGLDHIFGKKGKLEDGEK